MYEAFYGLTEKPFNLTPDPRFLFLSEKHKEAFAHLLYGIKHRTGFVMVSGEIGTGKTTICRSLLSQLDPDTEVAFIFNPCLSPEELLRKINEEFGIASRGGTVTELIDELNAYLLDRAAQGKNCVLVIDEAQDLSPSVLEQVRLLSNLETETQKLLQIVLIGQPELAQHLQLPQLRQLNQRITARYHLKPLDQGETVQYIAYRLRVAGGRKKVHFTRGAVRAVYRYSGGTPRVINAICDRALLIGYTKEIRDLTACVIRRAAKEIRGEAIRMKGAWRAAFKRLLPNPSLLVTAVVILLLATYFLPVRYSYAPAPGGPAMVPAPPLSPVSEPAREGLAQVSATVQEPQRRSDIAARAAGAEPGSADPHVSEGKPVERLTAIHPAEARNAAAAGMLRAWNRALIGSFPENDSPEAFVRFAEINGLTAEKLEATVDEITAIGLPALTLMKVGDQQFWVALLGVGGDQFRITGDGNGHLVVSKDEFQSAFANQAIIFWQDPNPGVRTLKNGVTGPEVAKLQQDLRKLARLSDPPSGVYEEKTVRAVAKLQAETGLRIDGMAGPQVRMVLSSWLPTSGTPSLNGIRDAKRMATPRPVSGTEGPASASGVEASGAQEGTEPPSVPSAAGAAKGEEASPEPAGIDTALPPVLLGPLEPFEEVTQPLTGSPVKLTVEDLPPPARGDVLEPRVPEVPKEVTPPVLGSVPVVPREPDQTDAGGEQSR